MTSEPQSKAERKKQRRKQRQAAERASGKALDQIAEKAIEQALELAAAVHESPAGPSSERALDIDVTTIDAARFVRKRVNEALGYAEWSDAVVAWEWQAGTNVREPLSEAGRTNGVEVRLEKGPGS